MVITKKNPLVFLEPCFDIFQLIEKAEAREKERLKEEARKVRKVFVTSTTGRNEITLSPFKCPHKLL